MSLLNVHNLLFKKKKNQHCLMDLFYCHSWQSTSYHLMAVPFLKVYFSLFSYSKMNGYLLLPIATKIKFQLTLL